MTAKKFSAAFVAAAFTMTGPIDHLAQALAQTVTTLAGPTVVSAVSGAAARPGSMDLRMNLSPGQAAGVEIPLTVRPSARIASLGDIAQLRLPVAAATIHAAARRGGVANSATPTQEPTVVSRFRRFAAAVRALGQNRGVRALRDPVQGNGQAAALDAIYDRSLDIEGTQQPFHSADAVIEADSRAPARKPGRVRRARLIREFNEWLRWAAQVDNGRGDTDGRRGHVVSEKRAILANTDTHIDIDFEDPVHITVRRFRHIYPWDTNKEPGYYFRYYELRGDRLIVSVTRPRWNRGSWRNSAYPIEDETIWIIDNYPR